MRLDEITREQKLIAAAAACGLWIISLFFPWYGVAGFDISGDDVVASFWIFLLLALAAGALLGAEGLRLELPEVLRPVQQGTILALFPLVITVALFLEGGGGRQWGIFLALIFAIAAVGMAVWVWRDEPQAR